MRRGLPVEERDLSQLDADAIARVREQARPAPRDAEELHDLLLGTGQWRAVPEWRPDFRALEAQGRAFSFEARDGGDFWAARERLAWIAALHPGAPLPAAIRSGPGAGVDDAAGLAEEVAIAHVLRGHLETTGPIDAAALAARLAVRTGLVETGLAALEAEGFVLRGRFDAVEPGASESAGEQFCARRLLARIHDDSQRRLRASVEPVSAQDFLRMLFAWQHVAAGTALEGAPGLARIVEQLQGFEIAAGAWEASVLPRRLHDYRPEWLDIACLSGHVSWLRLSPGAKSLAGTTRATPLSLVLRGDRDWLLQAHRAAEEGEPRVPSETAQRLLAELDARGAVFHAELSAALGLEPARVEAALWELVAGGQVCADGFQALRVLLAARGRGARGQAAGRARRGLRRSGAMGVASGAEGRWSRVPARAPVDDRDRLAEAIAEQLLARWGIVFRDVVAREDLAVPWREIAWALRRLEARGAIRGGRFVSGFTGEQFALPEALDCLARIRKTPRSGERVVVAGSDPLNLVGILTPGDRIPALQQREVVYVDGLPEEGR
ncbi:MAG: hypothetical protein R3E53_19545, partial [Myxococcota bacterium]